MINNSKKHEFYFILINLLSTIIDYVVTCIRLSNILLSTQCVCVSTFKVSYMIYEV